MKHWYAVNTKSREEFKALFNLKSQGFNTYLPRYKKTRRHARRIDTVHLPLFPKYLFVEFDMDMQNWSCINSTIGVSKLVKFGSLPSPIPKGFVNEIQKREDANGMVSLDRYLKIKKGDRITVVSGAFRDFSGVFECQSDDERVAVLLNLMGRDVRVNLSSSALSI